MSERLWTQAARAGIGAPLPGQRPTAPPIVPSTTFLAEEYAEIDRLLGGAQRGYVYSRNANPTVALAEQAIGDLEGGEAVAFGSGMAALHAAVLASGVRTGDTVALARDSYGLTRTLLAEVLAPLGVRPLLVDGNDLGALEATLASARNLRVVIVESITNPLTRVPDLAGVAAIVHRLGAVLIVDSTFATPVLLRPLDHGADLVMHSATKFLNGHGDVLAGAVVGRGALVATVRRIAAVVGGTLGPFDAWLLLRGLRTLPVRMERQCRNALVIAQWLMGRPGVAVYYPGLPDHPDHARAASLFPNGLFGAMIGFTVPGADRDGVLRFLDSLQLVLTATTLGDLFTEVSYPPIASHRGLTATERAAAGIPENLLRLSVGIEDPADIVADLDHAFAAAQ